MAKVPTTTQIGEYAGTIPGGYRGISESIPGDRAAAWRAVGQAGEQLARAGNVLNQQAIADQEVENDFQAATAVNEFSRRANERFVQYSELQGRAAVDGFGQYQTDVRAIRDEVLGGVTNTAVRRRLQPRLDGTADGLISGGQRYSVAQNRVALREATEATAATAVQTGMINRNDPRGFAAALNTGLEAVDALAAQQGADEPTRQRARAEFTGKFYSASIAAIAENDPLAAQRMFEQVRDQMDPASQIRVANMLEAPVRRRVAAGEVNPMFTPTDDTPEGVRARAFRLENPAGDARRNPMPGATASGPGQVTDGLWNRMAPLLGLRPDQRNSREAHEAIWDKVQLDARTAIGRPLTPGEQWGVWHLGQGGMQAFISAPRDADAFATYSAAAGAATAEKAFQQNPGTLRRGMTVGQVRDTLEQKMSSGGAPPDRNAMLRVALDRHRDNPEMQSAIMTEFNRQMTMLNAAQAGERAQLDRRVEDVARSLNQGSDVSIPEGDIRRLYEPARADAVLDRLATAQIAGQMARTVASSTPEELQGMREDLASGSGPISGMLRMRRGTRMEGDQVVEEDRASDVSSRGDVLRVLDERIAARNQQLQADPAQYAVVHDPGVREAAAAASAAPNDPEAMARYVTATTAAQARLGVPEQNRSVLSVPQALAIAADIQRADPGGGTPENPDGPALRLNGVRRQYGAAWEQVFGDLVRHGKLSPEYQVLANIPSAVGQADFARMLTAAKAAGGMNRLADALPRETRAALERDVTNVVAPFARTATASGASGGTNLAILVGQSVQNLATYYALQGQDPATALKNAADRIINDKYEIQGTMRVPRRLDDGTSLGLRPVMAAQAEVMRNLTTTSIADISGNPALTDDQRRDISWAAAQRGQWVPNRDDTGLILMAPRQDGAWVPVRWAGSAGNPEKPYISPGGMVELRYDRLPASTIPGAGQQLRGSLFRAIITGGRSESEEAARPAAPPVAPAQAPARPVQPGERGAPRGRQRWEAPQ